MRNAGLLHPRTRLRPSDGAVLAATSDGEGEMPIGKLREDGMVVASDGSVVGRRGADGAVVCPLSNTCPSHTCPAWRRPPAPDGPRPWAA